MAELSKQALKVENNTSFPNNNNGAITPSILRAFNVDMIDSLVDQIGYASDSGSWNQQIDALEQFTASASGLTTGSLLTTASANDNVITFTKGDASTFNVTINNTNLNQFTASANQRLTAIESVSGSWITESETGSFARYNVSNPWSADQTFTNITALSASFTYLKTLIETSSVIYSSGSNQFGDAADDVQTLYGQVKIINALTASGLIYPTADNGAKSFIQTDGAGRLSLEYVDTIFETFYAGESVPKGTPLYFSGSQGANPIAYAADAADSAKMPVIVIANENLTQGNTYEGIVLGLIEGLNLTGYTAGQTVYVAEGGGYSTSLPSGSNSITQILGIVTKGGNGGKGLVLNPGPAQLPGLQTGYIWQGNGSNRAISVTTSSFYTGSYTGSFKGDGSNLTGVTASISIPILDEGVPQGNAVSLNFTGSAISATVVAGIGIISVSGLDSGSFNSYTASNDQRVSSLEAFTGSASTSITNLNSATASLFTSASLSLVTASFDNGTRNLTFTKGDASTFSVNIPDVSGSGGGDFVTTSSFNNYTSSNDQRVSSLEAFSSSAEISISNLNSTTASLITSVNNLNGATSSYVTEAESGSFLITASFASQTLTFTKGDGTTFGVVIPDISGSTIDTGSFATTGSNSFNGDQYITGGLYITGGAGGTLFEMVPSTDAFYAYNYTEEANKIISVFAQTATGSISIKATDTHTAITDTIGNDAIRFELDSSTISFNAPVNITGSLTASLQEGYVWVGNASGITTTVPTSSFGSTINTGSFATTGSNTFDGNQTITGSVIISSSATTDLQIQGRQLISGPTTGQTPQLIVSASDANTTIGRGTFTIVGTATGNYQASNNFGGYSVAYLDDGSEIAMNADASQYASGWTKGPSISINNPSDAYPAVIGFENKTNYTDGRVSIITPLHSLTSSFFDKGIEVTGSFNLSGSAFISGNILFHGDSSIQTDGSTGNINLIGGPGGWAALQDSSASNWIWVDNTAVYIGTDQNGSAPTWTFGTDGKLSMPGEVDITGTLTASLSDGYVWVGDSSGKTYEVATSSFGGGGGAAFPYTGSALITGSLEMIGPLFGNVITLSVASSTASVDMNQGNMFVLNIPTGSTTHINVTNIRAGQTMNLLLKQASGATTGSLSWSPTIKFPSGLDLVPTATGSAMDLVSMLTFDTGSVIAANVKNLS